MKILIIDDDMYTRKLLKEIIISWGHEIVECSTAEEGLEFLKHTKVKLIISDWIMNLISGPEFCKIIREQNNDFYTYIILLTSKNNKEELIIALDSGADDFISKPFNIEELKVKLRNGERIIKQDEALNKKNEELLNAYKTMERDLNAAAQLQKVFLPGKNTKINVLQNSILPNSNHIENNLNTNDKIKTICFDWLFIPSSYLAGDVFNVVRLDEKNFGVYLVDVAGHGVPASLLSITLSRMLLPFQNNILKKSLKYFPFYEINPPAKLAKELNNFFLQDIYLNRYFTLTYLIINIETGVTSFCRAGNPSLLILRGENIIKFDSPSFPVGLLDDAVFDNESTVLQAGDKIFIFSDGIIEAENESEEMFGEDKLISLIKSNSHLSCNDFIRIIENEVNLWSNKNYQDDLSLLLVEIS